jgi:hypothetical protein
VTDIDEVLAGIKPAQRTVPVCIDGTLGELLDEAKAEWADAVEGSVAVGNPAVSAALDRIRDLEAQAESATVEFTVRNIGRKAWRKLITEHPPPADDLEGWRFDPETFPVAALAASCVDPVMTLEQADLLAAKLSDGQFQKLSAAVFDVNVGDDLIPKFAPALDATQRFEAISTTASPEGSPTASSSAPG